MHESISCTGRLCDHGNVNKTFRQVNIHKAAWPDGLSGRVLRACAGQLASFFTDIFNLSLSMSAITTCFKQTTIVPVPKNTRVTCLNNDRQVALTSVATKCFEGLVMAHINTIIPENLDSLQFAYRLKRFSSMGLQWSRLRASSSLVSTSPTN